VPKALLRERYNYKRRYLFIPLIHSFSFFYEFQTIFSVVDEILKRENKTAPKLIRFCEKTFLKNFKCAAEVSTGQKRTRLRPEKTREN